MAKNFVYPLAPGTKLQNGKYFIMEVLGQNYFSITYLATQSILNTRVIVHEFFLREFCGRPDGGSVLNKKLEDDIYQKFNENWYEEAKTLARFRSNEHLVPVMDTFEENHTIYYTTSHVNGDDLVSYTLNQKDKMLPTASAIDLITQISNGLSFIHENDLLHLDLSPMKVLVDKSNRAVIVNIGLSRNKIPKEVIHDNYVLNKAGYSAPEFYHNEAKFDQSSDVYSLGALLYFMLTGKEPVAANNRDTMILPEPISLNPLITPSLNRAIMKALSIAQSERFPNTSEFIRALQHDEKVTNKTKKRVLFAGLALSAIVIIAVIFNTWVIPGYQKNFVGTSSSESRYADLSKMTVQSDATRGISLVADSDVDSPINVGKFYALLIGIEDYKDPEYSGLTQPISDASSVGQVLIENYTFEPENVTTLKNPKKKEIFKVLNDYRTNLTEDDNLFVFYAGHGFYDDEADMGYMIPSDADHNNDADWISFQDVRKKFDIMKAKHVLFIADACYAGSVFSRGSDDVIEGAPAMTIERLRKKSRTAFTSADLKPVLDKSVFLEHLISNLKNNSSPLFLSEDLYINTRNTLMSGTTRKDPVKWGILQDCGDEGGDFIFVKRKK